MADCPKCNHHLKMTDWRQSCPYCGANIVIYDLQERLMKEADVAEVQYYHFQKKVDRLKFSFVGSKLSILRIVTSLIPIAALLLPIINVRLSAPFEAFEGNIGAIDIYQMFEKIDLSAFMTVIKNGETATAGILFTLSAILLILSIVIMLVHFLCLTMASSPKGKLRNFTLDIIFIAIIVIAAVLFMCIPENTFVSGTLGIGAYLYLLLAVVNLVVDILVFRQKLSVKHSPCFVGGIPIEEYFAMVENGVPQEEIREEMYRRLTDIQRQQEEKLKKATEKKEEGQNG